MEDPDNSQPSRLARRALTWTAAGVVLIGAATWVSCRHTAGAAAAARPSPRPVVVVSRPAERELEPRLEVLGQLSAVDQVELRAQVGGTLKEIHFKDGEIVHRGDLLFVVDPLPYEIALAKANAQLAAGKGRLELTTRDLDRSRHLVQSGAVPAQDVDRHVADHEEAQGAVDSAAAMIRDAQFDLDRCRVHAPFTGRIGNHLVSVGSLVSGNRTGSGPTTLLATLVSLDPIYMNFDISEADYLTLAHPRGDGGIAVSHVLLAVGDEQAFERPGTFDFVDNAVDRSSGTIHARATVPNADLRLVPGIFARVRVAADTPAPTLLVPDSAVLPDQSSHLVMTVGADGTVQAKKVELGDLRGGLRVVRAGLASADRVIIDGLPAAAPGSKVDTRDGAVQFVASAGGD